MSKTRFTQWIVLACIGSLAACTSGEGGTVGNTEVNVVVPNGYDAGSSAPALIDIQDVEYTVDCAGNNDQFLDNNASFPDEVTLNGNLEVQDGRTNAAAIYGDPAIDGQAEIWQGFMDLPPGPCTIELRARDDDGEVICTASQPFIIASDATTKVNIVLICDISFQAPVGMLDVDGTFSFNVGNFCPDLFILNCMDSLPQEAVVLPPPNPPIAGTGCQVRFRDGDNTCGQGCDPQTCVPNGTSGLTCTPGPDPLQPSTIVTCTDAWLDCQGDGVPDAQCDFTGNTVGDLAQQPPAFPGVPGVGGFFLTCIPPVLGGTPGATATCTAVTTDGDVDCDKTKVVEVTCPGLTPCTVFGGDAACQAAAGTVCVSSTCNEGTCDGATAGACCDNANAPATTDCAAENGGLPAECDGAGACQPLNCTSDAQCDSGAACTDIFAGICNVGTGVCAPEVPSASGTACEAIAGQAASGACDGAGACTDICTFNPACPDDAVGVPDNSVCTAATCDPNDGTCGQAPANNGGGCDFSGPGSADGTCVAGVCGFTPPDCGIVGGTVQIGCTNGVTTAQSPFPNQLSVTVSEPVFSGAPFTADASGIGAFPKFFLDAAQGTVPGGVRSAIIEGFNVTVELVNGAGQILLQADPSGITPGLIRLCNFPATEVCTCPGGTLPGDSCASGPPCLGGTCEAEVLVADVPLSEDCGPGGICEGLGQGTADGPTAQCNITDPPSFCVTGDLLAPLYAPGGPQVVTAGAAGNVSFGWAVDPGTTTCPASTDSQCASNGGTIPDGGLILPDSVYGDPVNFPATVGLNGIRLNVAGALFVALQCSDGSDGGACVGGVNAGLACANDGQCPGSTCAGIGVDDDIIVPTPVANKPFCPIL